MCARVFVHACACVFVHACMCMCVCARACTNTWNSLYGQDVTLYKYFNYLVVAVVVIFSRKTLTAFKSPSTECFLFSCLMVVYLDLTLLLFFVRKRLQ